MAIWPHEVGRIAGEPCARRVAAPRKDVQRQSARRAPCSQAATGAAVHVHLPLQRLERREVVRRGLDPWQAIAAADAPGAPLAQAALPILDRRLGDGAKQEAPHRWQPDRVEITRGATCTRTRAASRPLLVTNWKTRSVVATRRRAKPIRSGS